MSEITKDEYCLVCSEYENLYSVVMSFNANRISLCRQASEGHARVFGMRITTCLELTSPDAIHLRLKAEIGKRCWQRSSGWRDTDGEHTAYRHTKSHWRLYLNYRYKRKGVFIRLMKRWASASEQNVVRETVKLWAVEGMLFLVSDERTSTLGQARDEDIDNNETDATQWLVTFEQKLDEIEALSNVVIKYKSGF